MKLSEKIYYCRKKEGKSQEALAEDIGVSRQAVSKWETGDSEPEISKLKILSETFGVTVDWLLSDEEPDECIKSEKSEHKTKKEENWIDSVPGTIGRLLRRYGWLFGIYVALVGAGAAFIGFLARMMTNKMFGGLISAGYGESMIMIDNMGNIMEGNNPFISNNPVYIMGTAIMIIGIIIIIAGILFAVIYKKKSSTK